MLRIDITTCTRVLPEHITNANRILDEMERERSSSLSDWMTARNGRGNVPQFSGFRTDWYEYEEEYLDNLDRQ